MSKARKTHRPIKLLETSLKRLNEIVKRRGGKAFTGAPHKKGR